MNSWKPKQPPKFSGSIVISRKAWLNTKANLDRMWQGHLDHGTRNNLFGKIIMLDMVKDGTLSEDMNYSWNDHVQYNLWKGYYRVAPAVTFEWLFDPTPLEREETIHLYTLLRWAVENEERVQEVLKELGEE